MFPNINTTIQQIRLFIKRNCILVDVIALDLVPLRTLDVLIENGLWWINYNFANTVAISNLFSIPVYSSAKLSKFIYVIWSTCDSITFPSNFVHDVVRSLYVVNRILYSYNVGPLSMCQTQSNNGCENDVCEFVKDHSIKMVLHSKGHRFHLYRHANLDLVQLNAISQYCISHLTEA